MIFFRILMGVKTNKLRNREYGRRRIPTTARHLLYIAQKYPAVVSEIFKL